MNKKKSRIAKFETNAVRAGSIHVLGENIKLLGH